MEQPGEYSHKAGGPLAVAQSQRREGCERVLYSCRISDPMFLSLNAVDILSLVIMCCGGSLVHYRTFNSTPSLFPK